jgi:hypothetical protein
MRCAAIAALAVALAFAWQTLTVRFNFGGNWTALFTAGEVWRPPAAAEFRGTYIFRQSQGYDGQFYRYLAHDPLFEKGYASAIDAPRLRSRRILAPGLAYLLAWGQAAWIDGASIAVTLCFVFLGVYWTARWAAQQKRNPAWGLAFLAVPATIVSVTRITVDVALAALACAWVLFVCERWKLGQYVVLALLPLARETGLLFNAASAFVEMRERRWKRLVLVAATGVPLGAWAVFVARHTPPGGGNWFGYLPLTGLVHALFSPPVEHARPIFRAGLVGLDYLALAGMALAIGLAARAWWRRRTGTFEIALALFALLAVQTGSADVWSHAYNYARVFSPLLVLLGLRALAGGGAYLALPVAMILPRMAAEQGLQFLGILGGAIR